MATLAEKEKLIREIKGIQRIVINACHGGFGLSDCAMSRYKEMAGITDPNYSYYDIHRDDPYLVKTVLELGEHANGSYSELKVVEVPGDVDWQIEEYDGKEWVSEVHRIWE